MPTYRSKRTGCIWTGPTKLGKYRPHIGAKESAKFVKRQQEKELKCAATS